MRMSSCKQPHGKRLRLWELQKLIKKYMLNVMLFKNHWPILNNRWQKKSSKNPTAILLSVRNETKLTNEAWIDRTQNVEMYNNYAPVFFGIAWNTWHNLFNTSTAPFMGHVLRPEGLKLSTEIVTAALDMPPPQDKAASHWFLGTTTYLAKFSPNLSKVVRPLHNLTHLKQEFLWFEQHSNAFTEA